MIFRTVVFIFLSLFVLQSFAKYTSHCSFHVEGVQENLHLVSKTDQLKQTDFKVSNPIEQSGNEDARDCDCPVHGTGCCLYSSFILSTSSYQFTYENHPSEFSERLRSFLPNPDLDTPFQPPRI